MGKKVILILTVPPVADFYINPYATRVLARRFMPRVPSRSRQMARVGIAGSKRKGRQTDAGGGAGVEANRNPSTAEEEEEGGRMDPLEVLGMDIMTRILQLSAACSVARCTVVSRGWHEIAVSDRLWGPKVGFLPSPKSPFFGSPMFSTLSGYIHVLRYSELGVRKNMLLLARLCSTKLRGYDEYYLALFEPRL